MQEFVDVFRDELNSLIDDMYEKIDELVYGAMWNMDFFNSDSDANYAELEKVMVDVIRKRLVGVLEEDGESN